MSLTINYTYFMSQLERIAYIDRHLQDNGLLTIHQVVDYFEISDRQVKRDIEYLRNRLDAPIEYDTTRKAYHYAKPFDLLRFADERMLLFYVLVRSLAGNATYLPVNSHETLNSLEQSIGREYRSVSNSIHYHIAVSDQINLDHFSVLCRAIKKGNVVHLSYMNIKGEKSERDIEIGRLVNYMGHWYAISWDQMRKELRTFNLSRIISLNLKDEHISWLSTDIETRQQILDQYIHSGFGIFNGNTTRPVTIRFYNTVIPVIRMQQWHESQIDTEGTGADGICWLDRTLPANDISELLGRILSFGQFAEIIQPADFRQRWVDTITAMYQRLQSN